MQDDIEVRKVSILFSLSSNGWAQIYSSGFYCDNKVADYKRLMRPSAICAVKYLTNHILLGHPNH